MHDLITLISFVIVAYAVLLCVGMLILHLCMFVKRVAVKCVNVCCLKIRLVYGK